MTRKNPSGNLKVGENVFSVDIASTTISRMRGLSGREKLNDNQGMLFIFDTPGRYGFWMLGMKFPLDIIWIRSGKVIGFSENLPASKNIFDIASTTPESDIDMALEVNAGTVKSAGIKPGDPVSAQ